MVERALYQYNTKHLICSLDKISKHYLRVQSGFLLFSYFSRNIQEGRCVTMFAGDFVRGMVHFTIPPLALNAG